MSPLKRKRLHDAPAPESPPSDQSIAGPAVTRRATRQTSIAPLPYTWAADPEPRRRRRRRRADTANSDERPNHHDDDVEEPPVLNKTASLRGRVVSVGSAPAPGRERGRGRPSAQQHRPVLRSMNQADPGLKSARNLRHHPDDHDQNDANGIVVPMHVEASANLRACGSAAGPVVGGSLPPSRAPQKHPPGLQSMPSINQAPAPMTQVSQPRSVKISDHVAANTSKPFTPPTFNSTKRPPKPAKKQQPAKDQKKPSNAERNIDKVVFGNICFSTWYHSPYGTEALGEISGNSAKANTINGTGAHDGGNKEDGLANTTTRRTKGDKLDRLYVCPCCFKYSKELVPWWQHVHLCERRSYIPGEKIYTHPRGLRTRQVPVDTAAAAASKASWRKKKTADASPQTAEEVAVEDQGEWSVWQVDGEQDGLFCQNLSLFAKLFLDNKSVFFDVVGFNYFLLVYTSPHPIRREDQDPVTPSPAKHQIVGFFSKEKLSWDNNNLACILVFPPWQRKGLGALLMGVSYEISKREGVLGGPEKPISDLGKRGYKRFWAGEIASWILSLDTSGEEEVVVDVEECSKATWIVPEDCLLVLREMGVVEEAGLGLPKPKKREAPPKDAEENGEAAAAVAIVNSEKEDENEVPRVRVTKEAVRAWVKANRINLEKTCDSDGFVEGYAIKKTGTEEEEE